MSRKDELIAYLNDHLTGSTAALQLLDHQLRLDLSREAKEFYTTLYSDIEQDQKRLEEVIRRAGGEPSTLRKLGGWFAEKISRLKLALDEASSGSIEHFEALEILVLGIHGKRALWRALEVADLPALQGIPLEELQQRAQEQIDRVEERRLAMARTALTIAA